MARLNKKIFMKFGEFVPFVMKKPLMKRDVRLQFIDEDLLLNSQVSNFQPGSGIFQCTISVPPILSPGSILVVNPDHQPQGWVGGTSRGKDFCSVHVERAAISQPLNGIIVPLADIQIHPDTILPDHPAGQTSQKA